MGTELTVSLKEQLDKIDSELFEANYNNYYISRFNILMAQWKKGEAVSKYRGVNLDTSFRAIERETGRSGEYLKKWNDIYENNTIEEWKEKAEIKAQEWAEKALKPKLIKASETPPLPEGKYQVIYADPPWKYTSGDQHTDTSQDTVIGTHYPSMTIEELCDLPVIDIAHTDCILFLWVTSPLLEESFQVINAWGFDYKTSMVWDKMLHNVGHDVSVRHEFLLICKRGQPPKPLHLVDSVYSEERTQHSKKPVYFRQHIEREYPDTKRIELFLRGDIPEGWDAWGNEI